MFNEYSRQNANAIDQFRPRTKHLLEKYRMLIKYYAAGVVSLRSADGSVMPRVTTGNTMAPCVIIGERAGEMLKADHKL